MMRVILPLILFAGIATVLGVGLTLQPGKVPSPLINQPAPDFVGPTLHDPDSTLSLKDISGRVAVVNVWASWCAACRDEHPFIISLAEEVPVYGINYKDRRPDAKAWLERNGDAYTSSVYDPDGEIGLDWGVYGVPETYLLDAQGTIRYKHIGGIDERVLTEELLPRIRRLRGERG